MTTKSSIVKEMPLSDQPVILITGASSGIGAATAQKFAREGYRVVLTARRFERLLEQVAIIEAAGGQAFPIRADLSRYDDICNMVAEAQGKYGQIDVLFNNAGFGRLKWLERLDPHQDIEAQIQVNLLGAIHTTQQLLPGMIARRKGHIVNMASAAGLVAMPTYSIYAATKFGLRGFSEALRREVGIYGIRVSVIYPGGVETEFKSHTGLKRKTGITTPPKLRLTAEKVAEEVWKLVQRPRRSVVLPGIYRLAVSFNSLLPGMMDWIVDRRFTQVERK